MDELTQEQVDELRGDLETARDELKRLLELTRDGARPVALDEPIGRLTRMDAIQQQQMARANRETYAQRLAQIHRMLESFDDESYGLCSRCDEPIGYRRLKIRPEAPICIGCLEKIESRG